MTQHKHYNLSIRQRKDMDNIRADLENQKEQMETQRLLTRYVAEMNDIYIPEEDDENVQNSIEIEK